MQIITLMLSAIIIYPSHQFVSVFSLRQLGPLRLQPVLVKRRNEANNPALQALETVVRFFLLKANGQAPDFPKTAAKATSITYTDYRSLRSLVRLNNENLTGAQAHICVRLSTHVASADDSGNGVP
jgi:hypothetical protein